ncbi:hypothetical protein GLOIN_2v1710555, partial [Rhizophagus irregularis DAOM 181602=DAOM 197198]
YRENDFDRSKNNIEIIDNEFDTVGESDDTNTFEMVKNENETMKIIIITLDSDYKKDKKNIAYFLTLIAFSLSALLENLKTKDSPIFCLTSRSVAKANIINIPNDKNPIFINAMKIISHIIDGINIFSIFKFVRSNMRMINVIKINNIFKYKTWR